MAQTNRQHLQGLFVQSQLTSDENEVIQESFSFTLPTAQFGLVLQQLTETWVLIVSCWLWVQVPGCYHFICITPCVLGQSIFLAVPLDESGTMLMDMEIWMDVQANESLISGKAL